jgi:hypothetical protein
LNNVNLPVNPSSSSAEKVSIVLFSGMHHLEMAFDKAYSHITPGGWV